MVRLILLGVALVICTAASAESVQEYCNNLYPADSYDASDRAVYVQECVEMYAEDFAASGPDSAVEEPSEPEDSGEDDMLDGEGEMSYE
ncbi:hypothetical protein [Teredinibacter turnerae]|uniref:hypothetical protein n=1 Tax=Teredinibacter turnerae TaxID=2426 RepID=UPI00036E93A2|nr:hypothetical protein [Teredinibacter turnerae]